MINWKLIFCTAILTVLSWRTCFASTLPKLNEWSTWKRSDARGKVERIVPHEGAPNGAMRFMDVPGQGGYAIQAYVNLPANLEMLQKYRAIFRASDEVQTVNVGIAVVKITRDGKRLSFTGAPRKTDVLAAGKQVSLELELSPATMPLEDAASYQVIVFVEKLAGGVVDFLAFESEEQPLVEYLSERSSVTTPAGYSLRPLALRKFHWPERLESGHFIALMDSTALGCSRIHLHPEHGSTIILWPEGDAIKADFVDGVWVILAGETVENLHEACRVQSEELELAFYGTGVVVREWGKQQPATLVEGGLTQNDAMLCMPENVRTPEITRLEFIDEVLQQCYLLEAERRLETAQELFNKNLPAIKKHWGQDNYEAIWRRNFSMLFEENQRMQDANYARSEHLLEVILANPLLMDRYSWLVWQSYNRANETNDYFGGHFRKIWFSHLGGMGVYRQSMDLCTKTERLVSRSRRIAGSSFTEGNATQDGILSAGWVDSLTVVPQKAGLPANLSKKFEINAALGEAESAQLVLSTGRAGVKNISFSIDFPEKSDLRVDAYMVDYVWMDETATFQMPEPPGGDVPWPDILQPYNGDRFDMESYANKSLWITVTPSQSIAPGTYNARINIMHDGETVVSSDLSIVVCPVKLKSHSLFGKGGMRNSSFREWYEPQKLVDARHNFMENMWRHQMDPLDGYSATPVQEDIQFAKELGMNTFTMGGDIDNFAPPLPDMVKHIRLYASEDGEHYHEISATATLEKRNPSDPLSDYDLVVRTINGPVCEQYLKVHDDEVRDWFHSVKYDFFGLYPDSSIPAVQLEIAGGDNVRPEAGKLLFFTGDKKPEIASKPDFSAKTPHYFTFGSLRSGSNLTSIVINAEKKPVTAVRLSSRKMENGIEGAKRTYERFRKVAPECELVLYGFDETGAHLNEQLLAAVKNARLVFPDAKLKIRTSANDIDANSELYKYINYVSRSNAYSSPREEDRIYRRTGCEFQVYAGGGGYYPFGNFERADQPFVISRAFFWSFIAFEHFKAWGYFDGHFWRKNLEQAGKYPVDYTLWNPTHGQNNGMGALFYPGPNEQSWPSIRAELMRDGIEDAILFRMAAEKLRNAPDTELEAELHAIRKELAPSMSCYEQMPEKVHALHQRLLKINTRLANIP